MRFVVLVLPFLAAVGVGCSHGLKGRPVDERTSIVRGIAMSATPVGGCIVRAGVKDVQASRLTMMIEVLNQTSQIIPLKASDFLVKGSAVRSVEMVFPIDPERTIASAAAAIEILEEKLNPSLFSVASNITDTSATDLKMVGDHSGQPMDDRVKLEHFRAERARWEREALRDAELMEMNRAQGFLHFDGEFSEGSFQFVSQNAACPADLMFELD